MYCLQISVYRSSGLICGAFYERLAETFDLPSLQTLMKSLQSQVEWPGNAQVYYLEDMRENSDKARFQVRFSTSAGKDLISVFLSIQQSQVENIAVQFPARGDRSASSKMLEILKSLATRGDIECTIEGFMEMGTVRFIREKKLSGFVWVEGLGRYLHITEDPRRVKEVEKGFQRL